MLIVAKMQHGTEKISNNIPKSHIVDVPPCTSNNQWSVLIENES